MRVEFIRPLSSFIAVLPLLAVLVAQSAGQTTGADAGKAASAPAQARIGSSAIWEPGPGFVDNAQQACKGNSPGTLGLCLIEQMAKAGAPHEAVEFSRRLYDENGGEWGVMLRFQAVGPVDMAKVYYPLRDVGYKWAVGSRNYALLLVNGDPPILDVDDLKKLNQSEMEQDKGYQFLKQQHPGLKLWGGGRGGTNWESAKKWPDGGLSFDIDYVLNPTRPPGYWLSGAHFSWDFDAKGKFVGTRFTGGVGLLPD